MSELIVSYRVEGPNSTPYGYRYFADGLVEDYRVSKHVKGASGAYTEQAVVPGWYRVVALDAARVQVVREAVRASGLYSLTADLRGDSTSTDPLRAEWQFVADGEERRIAIAPWPTRDRRVQALFQLTTQLTMLLSEALA